MKKAILNLGLATLLCGTAVTAAAQADIPVIGALLTSDFSAGGDIGGLPMMGDLGGGFGGEALPPIPLVGAILSGAALEGSGPVLETILSPEFLTDPTPVFVLLSPEAMDYGSTVVLGIVGGLTAGLAGDAALPGL